MVDSVNPQRQHLMECCRQLRNIDEQCRCQAIREMVRQQQMGEGSQHEEMQEIAQKAQGSHNGTTAKGMLPAAARDGARGSVPTEEMRNGDPAMPNPCSLAYGGWFGIVATAQQVSGLDLGEAGGGTANGWAP
ncbi:hypothetical protein RJ639_043170 [Escallonia herrerae]|uniref:Bifunctional inhibitor/plant lipid transfer protein/seed storage helical domain-containing protein n=1 Tax=Escallonia herrerae TaxID=1293975 RepID=A0AA88WES8_9ASTE|nr:hypothetical protein RJ639_043170 [Escallonia herrerae]